MEWFQSSPGGFAPGDLRHTYRVAIPCSVSILSRRFCSGRRGIGIPAGSLQGFNPLPEVLLRETSKRMRIVAWMSGFQSSPGGFAPGDRTGPQCRQYLQSFNPLPEVLLRETTRELSPIFAKTVSILSRRFCSGRPGRNAEIVQKMEFQSSPGGFAPGDSKKP